MHQGRIARVLPEGVAVPLEIVPGLGRRERVRRAPPHAGVLGLEQHPHDLQVVVALPPPRLVRAEARRPLQERRRGLQRVREGDEERPEPQQHREAEDGEVERPLRVPGPLPVAHVLVGRADVIRHRRRRLRLPNLIHGAGDGDGGPRDVLRHLVLQLGQALGEQRPHLDLPLVRGQGQLEELGDELLRPEVALRARPDELVERRAGDEEADAVDRRRLRRVEADLGRPGVAHQVATPLRRRADAVVRVADPVPVGAGDGARVPVGAVDGAAVGQVHGDVGPKDRVVVGLQVHDGVGRDEEQREVPAVERQRLDGAPQAGVARGVVGDGPGRVAHLRALAVRVVDVRVVLPRPDPAVHVLDEYVVVPPELARLGALEEPREPPLADEGRAVRLPPVPDPVLLLVVDAQVRVRVHHARLHPERPAHADLVREGALGRGVGPADRGDGQRAARGGRREVVVVLVAPVALPGVDGREGVVVGVLLLEGVPALRHEHAAALRRRQQPERRGALGHLGREDGGEPEEDGVQEPAGGPRHRPEERPVRPAAPVPGLLEEQPGRRHRRGDVAQDDLALVVQAVVLAAGGEHLVAHKGQRAPQAGGDDGDENGDEGEEEAAVAGRQGDGRAGDPAEAPVGPDPGVDPVRHDCGAGIDSSERRLVGERGLLARFQVIY
ncbi:hypothetical protein CTA2_3866 [Colletotrichum tanaceti]|uniref:Uncharacterized protein n=1 Tax=Colletotrichum tanaceti TaxID=1306861 RepID=A0A4U6X6R5_9PEZI|nr:hypothetical protein CTA2_3866 [Colletotrichum tanaceti]TKW51161.1 hypothetical protein CTA1_12702 [Colletotrichum tanaceti]